MRVTIDEVRLGDAAAAWERLGFAVSDGVCAVGEVRLRLGGDAAAHGEEAADSDVPGGGILGWSLRGLASTELDGLPTERSEQPDREAAPAHPNGITGLDHVVAITPDLGRTVAALEAAGLDLRRVREEPTPAGAPRQAFFLLGAAILEVVQEPADVAQRLGATRPAFFWGLALRAPDLEATAAGLGQRCGEPRDAVQPGRRIATLRRSAGLGAPVALITPPA